MNLRHHVQWLLRSKQEQITSQKSWSQSPHVEILQPHTVMSLISSILNKWINIFWSGTSVKVPVCPAPPVSLMLGLQAAAIRLCSCPGGGGVTWENLGRLQTRSTAAFWIRCNGFSRRGWESTTGSDWSGVQRQTGFEPPFRALIYSLYECLDTRDRVRIYYGSLWQQDF